MTRLAAIAATAIALLAMPAASADTEPAKVATTSKGKVWADHKGMTLYTYDKDSSGKSTCNGQCAQLWPPHFAAADAKANGDWSIVSRGDGKKQWAYKGKPLYLWKDDKKPGDVTGDGVNNVWRLAVP
jgi:predicted lipoprotein with Yx(FWY)xxD motif